ncbi:RNA-binding protein Rsf1-like isoform X1 [Phymastichus coffea]|uniref:RNA-binding protein Rsf1-like isoform X1 n=2 Tax=Phymastichus coffea TaxID=108790 RepID=UPI00273CAE2C|nr:RNA-binding protein Rsf1-like isoform X1 [Phymastichus coffea]
MEAGNMTPDGYARVYVGGLNESIRKEDLQMQFEKFGKLNKVWVAFNPPGFAFIEYFNMDEAEMACSNMNGTDLMGAKLRVEISRGRGRGGRGGGRGRGGGGRGGSGGFRSGGGGYGSRGGGGGYDQGGGGGGSYYSGRGGGNSGRYGGGPGGGRMRDNYGGDVGAGAAYNQDAGNEYYNKDTGSSRYRSRSPAGRNSQRHLRECI